MHYLHSEITTVYFGPGISERIRKMDIEKTEWHSQLIAITQARSAVEAMFRCRQGNLPMSVRHDESGALTEGCLSGGAGNPIGIKEGETNGAKR